MNAKSKKLSRKIVVNSSTENLSHVRDFIRDAAEECGFSKETSGKIILAVDEACTNVIKHAYKYSDEGNITVEVKFSNSKFSISITDSGTHFDPNKIPEPNLKKYYDEKKVGGLGMFLMKKLMDEVVYNNLSNDRNQVVLSKYMED
ncbi:MAG: ATP-binding protein [Melioribacteraceae bacterium]|nr:ATP-binding protein [Melioribacteraceae bacterium]